MWSTTGLEKWSELFPFELSRMTSPGGGGGRLQGSYGTCANRDFPGVLARDVGGMGRTKPLSNVEQFTPAELLTPYDKEPYGVNLADLTQSRIDP